MTINRAAGECRRTGEQQVPHRSFGRFGMTNVERVPHRSFRPVRNDNGVRGRARFCTGQVVMVDTAILGTNTLHFVIPNRAEGAVRNLLFAWSGMNACETVLRL